MLRFKSHRRAPFYVRLNYCIGFGPETLHSGRIWQFLFSSLELLPIYETLDYEGCFFRDLLKYHVER
ncbi:hypothetical protein HHK36_025524 [Tetracentron sinense]|uniref:Uncharacterized protein n=1 Tax=Tetracentron sinense TaxID=13715 RepID=A0A834YH14_TETSI|nr:hypothetical protein HHK36_025524 [Tetracentron sinense]